MTREDLKKYYNTQKFIEAEKELYEENRVRAEELKAVVIDGMPKAKNKPNYAIEKLMDQFNEILERIAKQQEKQNAIIEQLERMDNSTYRLVLFYKYIRNYDLVKIANKMKYSYEHIKRVHGIALIEFDKKDDTKCY